MVKMKTLAYRAAVAAVLSVLVPAAALAQQPNYTRAERMLSWHLNPLIAGDVVAPRWMRGGDRFWYRNKTGDGAQFMLVDPVRATRSPLFDHDQLAAVMSQANDTSYEGRKLPFETFEFTDEAETTIRFHAGKKGWVCDIRAYTCTIGDTVPSSVPFPRSPDGKWEAFVKDYDLWIRLVGGGDSTRLTTDGQAEWAYGVSDWGSVSGAGRPQRPILQWSPDSKKIAVQRTDVRGVEKMPLYSSTGVRPKLYTYPYALPGDSLLNRFDIHIVDLESKANRKVDVPQQPAIVAGVTGMADSTWVTVKWGPGSDRLYFTHGVRGAKRIQLVVVGLDGRDPRVLAKDTSGTWVELMHGGRTPPNWAVAHRGEDLVWFSQRDGWAHFYRFGPDGTLRNRITSGPFAVDRIHRVDDATDQVYFTAWGGPGARFPYHRKLYRVGLDGRGLTLLTPEEADHSVSFTPSGGHFVDTWSTITEPPVTVLRRAGDGRTVLALEKADISRIVAAGWTPREVFTVKARDGITDLWGVLSKPSDFDPTKSYPVLEYIYPGPQVGSVGIWSFSGGGNGDVRAMAELGFIVVQLDHMGTPWRSKAFHDSYFGAMGDNGIPDHITALKQLAATRSWMDLDRVGIWGHSGGGFASTDAILRYPDFYRVAVSSSGNHDNRTYHYGWGEKYQGLLVKDTAKGTDNYSVPPTSPPRGTLRGSSC